MGRPDKDEIEFRKELLDKLLKCREDPSEFTRTFLGYEPFDYNQEYLNAKDKWIIWALSAKRHGRGF